MHVLIIGASKSGKTTRINEYIDGYNTYFVNYNDLKNHSDLVDNVDNFLNARLICSFFDKRPKLLVFDDIDILLAQDRSANKFITDIVKNNKCNTVITCVSSQEKRIMEIKKVCTDIVHIDSLKSSQFYFDNNIYDNVLEYFDNPHRGIEDIEYLLGSDIVVLSYIIYDNFYKYLDKCYSVTDNDIVSKVSEIYMLCCQIEDCGFNNNEWGLVELSNILKCYKLRCLQNSNKRKNVKTRPTITYTQIPSRAAQECTIIKKIQSIPYISYENIEQIASSYYHNTKKKTMGHKELLNSVCSTYLLNMLQK
jgi:hypothetical protein